MRISRREMIVRRIFGCGQKSDTSGTTGGSEDVAELLGGSSSARSGVVRSAGGELPGLVRESVRECAAREGSGRLRLVAGSSVHVSGSDADVDVRNVVGLSWDG